MVLYIVQFAYSLLSLLLVIIVVEAAVVVFLL